jgi:hypothetical protein
MSTLEGGGRLVTDGLIFYNDYSNPKCYISGNTTCNDLSSNQLKGTIIGTTFTGNSLNFNGISDSITIPNNSSLIFGTGNFTVSCWVKLPLSSTGEASGWGPIISKGMSTTAPANCWWIAQTGLLTNGISFHASTNGGGAYDVILNTTLSNGWHNILVKRDGSSAQLYIDGSFVTSGTSSSNLSTTSDLTICTNGTIKFTNTSISNIQIYNKSLTPQEIIQNFKATRKRFNV